ncbi:hypothetical protein AOQ71_09290 [Bradyrhizobium manausense]|uniref:Uncharacterized protein n=1 Tax=Bradyrhizobium manausense TaxID=989370 RepID=A0A0R3DZP3_9BRAD|nr:hypothetical protein AOQ71_09290 [Bradyrhizobium manausense]
MPTAVAMIAAAIADMINQKSHQSPFLPRNSVEAAVLALLMVSVMGAIARGVYLRKALAISSAYRVGVGPKA